MTFQEKHFFHPIPLCNSIQREKRRRRRRRTKKRKEGESDDGQTKTKMEIFPLLSCLNDCNNFNTYLRARNPLEKYTQHQKVNNRMNGKWDDGVWKERGPGGPRSKGKRGRSTTNRTAYQSSTRETFAYTILCLLQMVFKWREMEIENVLWMASAGSYEGRGGWGWSEPPLSLLYLIIWQLLITRTYLSSQGVLLLWEKRLNTTWDYL